MHDGAAIRRAAIIVALLLLAGAIAARGAEWYQSSDFFCLYQGSRSLVVGQDPYDELWWHSVTGGVYPLPTFAHGAMGSSSCPGRYGYPLWTAVALLPLGLVPLEVAAALWASLGIGATLFGLAATWRAVRGPRRLAMLYAVLVIASQPFWILLISGQLSGIELGLAGALVLALASRRESAAGIAAAALALKPQVVAFTIPALAVSALLRRRASFLGAAIATGLVMILVPVAFVPRWPLEWLNELVVRRLRVSAMLPTAWGLSADVFGNATLGIALVAAVLATVGLVLGARRPSALEVAVLSLPLSLFVSPYVWTYDYLVLAVPWAFLLARAPSGGVGRVAALLCIAALATLLPWGLYAVAFTRGAETLSAVVPALTAVAVAVAIRRTPAPET